MSLLRLANLRTIRSTIENLGGRFRRKADPGVRPLKHRRLLVDPLEERTLLSVSPADWADTQVNQSVIDYLPGNGTVAGQSTAVDNDGDFVVVWTRYDEVVHPVTGDPMIDWATGLEMTDANIYARYLTDEVQRLTLPDEIAVNNVDGSYGTFALVYGGAEVQKLSVTATYEPFTFFQESLSGSFDLGFDVNGDGAIVGIETATIFFDETPPPDVSSAVHLEETALDIQTTLQGLGGALANATVQGLNPHEYLIEFGPETAGLDQPQITVEGTSLTTGFLPSVLVSTVREPVEIANIPVSPDNADLTAFMIEQAFLQTSTDFFIGPVDFPPPDRVPGPDPVPAFAPDVLRTAVPRVSVTAVSETVFDITFSHDSGKEDHPELVVSAAEDDFGNPLMASTQIDVRTIKEPSPEFRVNPEEAVHPLTGLPDPFDQTRPAVAMDADGDFVIVWESEVSQWVNYGSISDIFARRFSPVGAVDPGDEDFVPGVRALGSQFRANTFTTNVQDDPTVGMDDDGNFVIAWANTGQDVGYFNGIVAQRFNRDGERLGSEFLVNTEDTAIHVNPYVGLSYDGHFVVAWDRTDDPAYVIPGAYFTTVQAEVYDPQGQVLIGQFGVGGGGAPTVAFDMNNNFLIGWDVIADADNIGITTVGIRARLYELFDAGGAVSGAVIRDTFRANSASLNPASATLWPLGQYGQQVTLDADGDVVISYDGYGPDASEDVFMAGTFFEELINDEDNADLLPFFNPLFDDLTPFFSFDVGSNGDVDGNIEQVMIDAANAGATDDQLGRLRAVLDRVAGLLRGEANGAMFSRWDADPTLGQINNLFSDSLANAERDGHNARYIIALDGLIDWDTFELGLSHPYVAGWEAVPVQVARPNNVINPYDTADNIDDALEAALRTGVNWPEPWYEGPVDVRVIDAFEILARQGTYWDLDNSFYTVDVDDYVFEVTFQGEVHDEDMYLWGRQGASTGNEVQILTISPFDPTVALTGPFQLTDGTNTSQNITFDSNNLAVTAAAIEAALINDLQYVGVQVTSIPGGPPYQFDITFAGQSGNTNQPPIQFVAVNDAAGNPMLEAGGGSVTIAQGGQTQVGPPDVFFHTYGDEGTMQLEASIGMEPDGDFVMAWSQYDEFTSGGLSNVNIHYRRFDESTDTAGPLATDFLLPSGERIEDGAQITEALNFITVTFDEEMMAGIDPSSVTDPDNWALMRDGIEMVGGISEIYFGMNMAADLATAFGLNPFGSNKWEAVIVLDGNGPSPGITALGDGHYEIVALNSLRDLAGNPLGRTGFNINGGIFSREFDVTVPTAGEVLVNADATGTQYTYPYSPQAVADDADGDYVVVWTDETVGQEGVYAKLYDVIWADTPAGRLSTVAEMMVINPDTGMPWPNNEIHVADDPTATFASVARDADGDFVVTWSQYDPLDSWDVYARRYDAAGNPLSDAFGVNSETEDVQRYSTVAMDVDGDFVVAWQSQDQDGSGYGIYAQRYSPSGEPLGGINEVQVLSFVNRPVGSFALFWDGDSTTPDVTVDIDFSGNTFDVVDDIQAALADIGAETEVEAISLSDIVIRFVGSDGSQDVPQISIDHALITGDPGAQITVRTGVNGAPGEFLVNQTTENNQQFASIAMSAEGDFVITWTSSGQAGDAAYETNVYARQFPSNEVLREVGFGAQSFAYGGNLSSYGDLAATWLVVADDPALHVVAPGAGFDGVVSVSLFGQFGGSGALLTSGSHILTASHVVTDFFGNPQNPANVSVTFDMPTGPVVIQASQILVHPSYNGDPFMGGDVAIIALEQQAPPGAERYDIYRNTDELGQVGTKYGYGTTGLGATGSTIPPDGNKRLGQNTWEALGGTLDPLTGVGIVDALIAYDFDNNQAANDAFDFLLGLADLGTGDTNEVCGAPGDSGGPTFIGNLIAGVVTGGIDFGGAWDVSPGIDSSFGDVGFDTRVSVYANWIDAAISLAGGPEFLVNQTITEDQKWSSVAMDHDGDFVITWTSYGQDGVGSGYGAGVGGEEGVFARRYDSDAIPTSDEFQVNTFADRNQQFSRIAMDADGDFVITWESFQDRPLPPFDAPGIDPDSPNSYGIYAQRYARTELVGQSPFLGPNGELGGELAINTTKPGDQRYPGIALDDTGDYVIGWSGNGEVPGQEDEQGIFHQRFNKPEDDAGPVVADVLNVVDAGGVIALEQVLENDVLETNVTQFVVSFGEDLSTVGGVNGVHSVLNTANWQLTHDGAVLFGGVASVEFGLSQAFLSGLAPIPSNKYEAVITFDADSVEPGNQPLGQGVYVLTASDNIEDIFGNALDGDLDGTPGGQFDFTFIVLIGISGPSGPGDPDADDDDPQINVTEVGIQNAPAVATDAEGNHVVVWVSYGQFGDAVTEGNIVAQRFNRLGEPLGLEFIVNSYLTGSQIDPDVAMDTFGNFVVTWSGEGEIDDSGVFARMFDAFGVAQGDQFRVNQVRQSVQDVARVAMDANGDFVVSWTSYGQDGDLDGVYARRYNSFGQAPTDEFLVNTTWYNRQENSDVAMDADGNFAIVWASYRQISVNSDYDLYAQRYDDAGNRLGGEFRINTYTNDKQLDAQIAMDADGDFVIVWSSFLQSPDTSGYGVYARRYTPAGTPKDPVEFLVNETILHWQRQPAVSTDNEGNFVVTWTTFDQDNEDDPNNGIYGRLYNADGSDFLDTAVDPPVPFGEFRINATTAGDQTDSAVAMDADGDFVVVWVGPDADQTGIFGRVVGVNTGSSGSGGSGDGSGGGSSYSGGGTGGGTGPVALGLTGTSGDDTFEFVAAGSPGSWIVKINAVKQTISPYTTSVSFDGRGGYDTVLFTGTDNDESVELWPDHGTFSGDGYTVSVINVESIGAEGLGGSDAILLYGSEGNDRFTAKHTGISLVGPGFSQTATGFESVAAIASGGGTDKAYLYDSPGDDTLVAKPTNVKLTGNGLTYRANFFDFTYTIAREGGADTVHLFDSPGNDALVAKPTYAKLTGSGFYNWTKYFESVCAYSTAGGYDTARIFDSAGNETFKATSVLAEMTGKGFSLSAKRFEKVDAYAGGGYDTAVLYDSPGDDTFVATPTIGTLSGTGFHNAATRFDTVAAIANGGGNDVAFLYDSAGDDVFVGKTTYGKLAGDGYLIRFKFFDAVHAIARNGGNDVAHLYGSAASDRIVSKSSFTKLFSGSNLVREKFFEEVHVHAQRGATDTAIAYDATMETGMATRDNGRLPAAVSRVLWLYDLEHVELRNDPSEGGTSVVDAVDEIFTIYWD